VKGGSSNRLTFGLALKFGKVGIQGEFQTSIFSKRSIYKRNTMLKIFAYESINPNERLISGHLPTMPSQQGTILKFYRMKP